MHAWHRSSCTAQHVVLTQYLTARSLLEQAAATTGQAHGDANYPHQACRCPLTRPRAVQVNYVGKAANLYEDSGYKLKGSSYVVNKLLGTTWLWDRVRVSGGAYGGFADFDSHSGMFSFLSYRDPNLLKTVGTLLLAPPLSCPATARFALIPAKPGFDGRVRSILHSCRQCANIQSCTR